MQTLDIRDDLQEVRDIAKSTLKLRNDKSLISIICIDTEKDVWVAEKYVDLFLRSGLDGWKCTKESPKHGALVKKWDDGRILLVMPMMGPEDRDVDSFDTVNMVAFTRN